jgi:hypothetical protein
MHDNLLFILGLLFVVMLLVMLAQKIRIAGWCVCHVCDPSFYAYFACH